MSLCENFARREFMHLVRWKAACQQPLSPLHLLALYFLWNPFQVHFPSLVLLKAIWTMHGEFRHFIEVRCDRAGRNWAVLSGVLSYHSACRCERTECEESFKEVINSWTANVWYKLKNVYYKTTTTRIQERNLQGFKGIGLFSCKWKHVLFMVCTLGRL